MVDLAGSFAVSLYAWAVMSNHTHVVLFIDPSAVAEWSDQEVAERWVRINRTLVSDVSDSAQTRHEERREALLMDTERLQEIRQRLGSLSWFMRFLNEAIALAANREDCCTGRFWEGRFHCKALTTDDAVLAAMSYADLNPVRAGLADRLETSEHTAIHRRLVALGEDPSEADEMLRPLAGPDRGSFPAITNAQYVELVDWSGRIDRWDKIGHITGPPPAWLRRKRSAPAAWLIMATSVEQVFGAAVGDVQALKEFAERTGRRWVRGIGLVRRAAIG